MGVGWRLFSAEIAANLMRGASNKQLPQWPDTS